MRRRPVQREIRVVDVHAEVRYAEGLDRRRGPLIHQLGSIGRHGLRRRPVEEL